MEELELRDYLRILRRRRWVVALALIACLGGGAAATLLTEPVYEARGKLFVGQRQIEEGDLQTGAATQNVAQQFVKSYVGILRTRPIAERAVERENLPIQPISITRHVRAQQVEDTRLIEISYQSTDPALAQRVVNSLAEAFIDEVERIETPRTEGAEPAVRVSVVEPALRPTDPIRPQPARNMALAGVLGLMVGVGLAFLREYLDTSIRGPEDVEQLTGTPVLAAIPQVGSTGSREVYMESDSQSMGAEAFRKLRTSIQFLGVDHPVQTVMVTSPLPQDGKTTTSLNLAAAFAQAGMRTILVEADLRRPTLHHVFPSDGQRGLTTCLIGRIPLEQAILPTPIRNLSHIPAGAVPPNPTELLASAHMADILNKLRARADIIVVDTPPLLPVADASALAQRADGVLIVVKSSHTHRERLQEAASLVQKAGGRLLGVVLNYISPSDSGYGYYYYGYSDYRSDTTTFETERTPGVGRLSEDAASQSQNAPGARVTEGPRGGPP